MSSITVTKILDGFRKAVFHVYVEGDVGGDLSKETIVDPVELAPKLGQVPSLTIEKLQYDLSGFSAELSFDYLMEDTFIWRMSGDAGNEACFESFGGLKDRSGPDGSGKLQVTTKGLGADDSGAFIVVIRKD